MFKKVVTLAHVLNTEVYGLERTYINRYSACQVLGVDHLLVVAMGRASDYDANHLRQFGKVLFLESDFPEGSSVALLEDVYLKYVGNRVDKNKTFIIRDDPHNNLRRFESVMTHFGYHYARVVHSNVYHGSETNLRSQLNRQVNYLVASEWLTGKLVADGFKATFIQPAFAEVIPNESVGRRYCFVGDNRPVKRPEWVLEAFERAPDVQLDVYGPAVDCDLPNVNFMGVTTSVPYQDYYGYISASVTENFANAMVEASGAGCRLLVSRNDCTEFCEKVDSILYLFDDVDGLVEGLTLDLEPCHQLAQRYSFDAMVSQYAKILKRGV